MPVTPRLYQTFRAGSCVTGFAFMTDMMNAGKPCGWPRSRSLLLSPPWHLSSRSCGPSLATARDRSTGCCRIAVDRHAASAQPAGSRWRLIQTPSGKLQRAAAYFAASTQRSDCCPVCARRKAGTRRACRQAAVQRFRDIPRKKKKQEFRRRCRSQSTSPGAGRLGVLACPILILDCYACLFPVARQTPK
jgi:hypothetical protein